MLGRFVLNMKPENVSATKVFDRGIDLLNDEFTSKKNSNSNEVATIQS